MFTRKQPHHEEYEMVDQSVPRHHTNTLSDSISTPAEGLVSDSRSSSDSQTSDVFDDLENLSAESGQKVEDFTIARCFNQFSIDIPIKDSTQKHAGYSVYVSLYCGSEP